MGFVEGGQAPPKCDAVLGGGDGVQMRSQVVHPAARNEDKAFPLSGWRRKLMRGESLAWSFAFCTTSRTKVASLCLKACSAGFPPRLAPEGGSASKIHLAGLGVDTAGNVPSELTRRASDRLCRNWTLPGGQGEFGADWAPHLPSK